MRIWQEVSQIAARLALVVLTAMLALLEGEVSRIRHEVAAALDLSPASRLSGSCSPLSLPSP